MAKLTISLPDPLKSRLEQYAQQHDVPLSQAVQQALEAFLETPAPAPPEPVPPPPDEQKLLHCLLRDIANIQRYLSVLSEHQERLRDCIGLVGGELELPLPASMPRAPWERGG